MATLSPPVCGLINSCISGRVAILSHFCPLKACVATGIAWKWSSVEKASFKRSSTCAVKMADEKRRIAKLETRAREAETALGQLTAYIALITDKGGGELTKL